MCKRGRAFERDDSATTARRQRDDSATTARRQRDNNLGLELARQVGVPLRQEAGPSQR
jgi:hypothetical protein